MAIAEEVYRELKHMPGGKQAEILDFVHFLKEKNVRAGTIASRSGRVKKRIPRFGSAKGLLNVSADFDKPIKDMKEYMR